jgi:hypothetical protein
MMRDLFEINNDEFRIDEKRRVFVIYGCVDV